MAQFMIILAGFGVVASASILLNSGILSILDGIALVLICGMIITAIIVMIQIWYFQSYQFQITKILIFIGLGLELAVGVICSLERNVDFGHSHGLASG